MKFPSLVTCYSWWWWRFLFSNHQKVIFFYVSIHILKCQRYHGFCITFLLWIRSGPERNVAGWPKMEIVWMLYGIASYTTYIFLDHQENSQFLYTEKLQICTLSWYIDRQNTQHWAIERNKKRKPEIDSHQEVKWRSAIVIESKTIETIRIVYYKSYGTPKNLHGK